MICIKSYRQKKPKLDLDSGELNSDPALFLYCGASLITGRETSLIAHKQDVRR